MSDSIYKYLILARKTSADNDPQLRHIAMIGGSDITILSQGFKKLIKKIIIMSLYTEITCH